jgi:putative hydrolase of the HAD superfamily
VDVTAICFDLDGTLLQLTEPYESVLAGVFDEHFDDPDAAVAEAYLDAFRPAFTDLEPAPYRTGMAAAVETAGADADPDELVAALLDAECRASTVPEPAREALATLGEDAALGVITNGLPDWQATKLDHHGLDDHFDAVVASYEAGAHKPDPAPFELARDRLPDAEEYAMVGDDYEADVEGARAAGFVPVHYEPGADDDGPGFWETLQVMV